MRATNYKLQLKPLFALHAVGKRFYYFNTYFGKK